MEQVIILSNPGSASKKYSVYAGQSEVAWFHLEHEKGEVVVSYKVNTLFQKKRLSGEEYAHSLRWVVAELSGAKIIRNAEDISAVSIRTVIPHPGFVQDMILDDRVRAYLVEHRNFDPLHINPVLDEIETVSGIVSQATKIFIISDSSFHISAQKTIALQSEGPVRTIGYHGLSCESVLSVLQETGISHDRLVICHLGGGCSVSGIVQGKSVYNSMEYSPLSGVTMATRSGSVDPFLVLSIMKEKNFTYDQMLDFLYTESGLKALSGVSGDLRLVREAAFAGDQKAKDTINLFVESIAAHVAKALAYTQGIDTLVFAGTIGLRAAYIREMVTARLAWLGITLNHDQNLNDMATCFEISAFDSRVKVYVVSIDEMREMHRHTANLLDGTV